MFELLGGNTRLENKYFCSVPWISMAIKTNGDLRICCHSSGSKSQGLFKNSQNQNINISKIKLEDVRNSDLVKEVRSSMLRNEPHEMCQRCDREQQFGLRSRREFENEKWKDQFSVEHAKKATTLEGTVDVELPLLQMDIRFGNLCNLSCRMCGPTDSTSWYSEFYSTQGDQFEDTGHLVRLRQVEGTKRIVPVVDPYQWHKDDDTFRQFDKFVPDLRDYYFAGGEPLLQPRHFELLEKIINAGLAHLVKIEYNTNLTVLPNEVIELWKHFKKVDVGVSLESQGQANEYIRAGSSWDKVAANIRKLDSSSDNVDCWPAVTMQIYNCLGVLDLIQWVYESKFKKFGQNPGSPFVKTHFLNHPESMCLRTLPLAIKKYVRQRHFEYFDQMKKIDRRFVNCEKRMNKNLDAMDGADQSHLFSNFIEKTKVMDRYRGQDFEKYLPELAQLFTSYRSHLDKG